MPPRKKTVPASEDLNTADYRHTGEKRTNIPPAKIAAEGKVPVVPKVRYHYNPHLPPVLRFDPTGKADKLPDLLVEAGKRPLKYEEVKVLAEAIRVQEPWLEWSAKKEQHEKGFFEVDPVALHIHERVSAQAIVRAALRKDVTRSLFADPEQPYEKAIQFYKHDVDWANRLILGDSLQVMSSLARRENLAGKVQMIYIDPPYGIKFASNFQPEVERRELKDRDADLTREPETVRAYRDTWTLGVHSYLAYLRDRLVVGRELLAEEGSIFVQISDENVHHLRELMDSVFGQDCFVVTFLIKKKGSQKSGTIDPVNDYVLWYSKSPRATGRMRFFPLLQKRELDAETLGEFKLAELPDGREAPLFCVPDKTGAARDYRLRPQQLLVDYPGAQLFRANPITSGGERKNQSVPFSYCGRTFNPGRGQCWKTTARSADGSTTGMQRLAAAGRLLIGDEQLAFKRYLSDFGYTKLNNWWDGLGGAPDPVYVVQTNAEIIQRCILMTTRPGDLVLDPTCGSGTTAYAAEQWGRRWIAIDTSRVAIAIARQRLLTAKFEHYETLADAHGLSANPGAGFRYRRAPHITLGRIGQNPHLDPIFGKYESILNTMLSACNKALSSVNPETRRKLAAKLAAKQSAEGKRAVIKADRFRWELPPLKFEHWTVPFDTDPDWPKGFQDAVSAYRKAWRAKMDEVNACIAANAEQEELVDQPEVVRGVLRVSGPFTVEGVRPEELSLAEDGKFGGAPDEDASEDGGAAARPAADLHAYLTLMIQHLRADGITFPNNKHRKFARLEPLFESGTGGLIHAEGAFEGTPEGEGNPVAVGFGPQYGPVTALQVEELIRASRRYSDLVVAGFSFDAAASAAIQEAAHPKLRIHQAYIRPDVNQGMTGLLKDTPGSQLFTVFGQPEVEVKAEKDGKFVVRLAGVDIYDPIENTVRSSGAEKVAAWFLDQDYDGRCFCTTQAFFPDQDAWEKIAKALGSRGDADAFEAFKGTESLPFAPGKHKRIAVKVIDPRGNEVMAVKTLKS